MVSTLRNRVCGHEMNFLVNRTFRKALNDVILSRRAIHNMNTLWVADVHLCCCFKFCRCLCRIFSSWRAVMNVNVDVMKTGTQMPQQRSWRRETMCASSAARRWHRDARSYRVTTSFTAAASVHGSSANRPVPLAVSMSFVLLIDLRPVLSQMLLPPVGFCFWSECTRQSSCSWSYSDVACLWSYRDVTWCCVGGLLGGAFGLPGMMPPAPPMWPPFFPPPHPQHPGQPPQPPAASPSAPSSSGTVTFISFTQYSATNLRSFGDVNDSLCRIVQVFHRLLLARLLHSPRCPCLPLCLRHSCHLHHPSCSPLRFSVSLCQPCLACKQLFPNQRY